MKKVIVPLPNIIEGADWMGFISPFIDVESSEAAYVNNRLSKAELQNIENVVALLKEHSKGHSNALWNLATCYDCGISTEIDVKTSKQYYMLANMQFLLDTEQIMCDVPEGEMNIGNLLDCAQAYEDAANKGYPCAMYFYGLSFLNGLGVSQDDKKASYWFKRASNVGLDEGTNALALNYIHGYGVRKNLQKAIELFKISAGHGNADGLYNLGVTLYNLGETQLGLEFISFAAFKGHKQALDAMKHHFGY